MIILYLDPLKLNIWHLLQIDGINLQAQESSAKMSSIWSPNKALAMPITANHAFIVQQPSIAGSNGEGSSFKVSSSEGSINNRSSTKGSSNDG